VTKMYFMFFDFVIIKMESLRLPPRLRARIQLVALLGWQPFLRESLKET